MGMWTMEGLLTLKFDSAAWHFLKFDRLHCTTLKSTGKFKNIDRGHCHFLKSTGDIGAF